MAKLILPRRFSNQPQVPVGPSELAKQLNVGALLLPTGSGWADATGRFERTGGTGSVVRVPTPSGMARTSSVGSAWADFVLDRGFHNPANGYAWVMRGSLKSVLGSWSGIIARTVDNATGQGWAWQRTNADVLTVYHAGSGYSNAGTLSQFVDGEEHTFVGAWRKSESRLELWVDGALRWSQNSASAAPAYTAGQGQIKVMSSRDTPNIHASVTMVGVFNGSLSAEVAREISINPWQLFKPQRQVLYFDIGAGGGLSVALNQATTTDTAQALGRVKLKAVGQASEIDSAQAVALLAEQIVAVNQADTTDSAQAVSPAKLKAIGQAVETGTVQAFTSSKLREVGQVVETNTAQNITPSGPKLIAVGQASETDFAQAVAKAKALGILQPVETDSAHSITRVKARAIGQVVDTSEAQPVTAVGGATPTLSPEDIASIAAAVWAHSTAVDAHAKLDAILARLQC